jgi:hypothetical protein
MIQGVVLRWGSPVMRLGQVVVAAFALAVLSATSVRAQDLASETEIRVQLPYGEMLAVIPTLTVEQYNAVVQELATALSRAPAASAVAPSPEPANHYGPTPATNIYVMIAPVFVNPYAATRNRFHGVANPHRPADHANPHSSGSAISPGPATNPFANAPGIVSFAPAAPVTPLLPALPVTR